MRPVRLIQMSLVGGSAVILALVAFYVVRASRPAAGVSTADGAAAGAAATDVLEQGYQVRVDRWAGANRDFSIQAPLVVAESEQATVLSGGVRAEAGGSDGHQYRLFAAQARGDDQWQRIRAEGDVRVERDDGLVLHADWAEHVGGTGRDTVGGGVRLTSPARLVACDRAEYDSRSGELTLKGGVSILERETRSGVSALLAARTVTRRLRPETIQAHGEVHVIGSASAASADRLDAVLEDGHPTSVTLTGNGRPVLVEHWADDVAACPEASAAGWRPPALSRLLVGTLLVQFDRQGQPRRVQQGGQDPPLSLEGLDGTEPSWHLAGRGLDVALDEHGRLQRIELASLDWVSTAPGAPAERVQAPRMAARFGPGGSLVRVDFPAGLDVVQGERQLIAERGDFAGALLTGRGNARLGTPQASVRAAAIAIDTATGALSARGEVETDSEAGAGTPAALQERGQRLRFRADEMESRDGGASVVYRGNVRAWQGQDVLQADTVRADKQLAGFEAEGKVTALLASDPARRLQATAERLSWRDDQLVLTGKATVSSPTVRLQAERVEIRLQAGSRTAERLVAEGDEVVTERLGVRAFSRRVVHDVASGRTEITAAPELARVVDGAGRESWGGKLTLWQEGERIVVDSGPDGIVRSRLGAAAVR